MSDPESTGAGSVEELQIQGSQEAAERGAEKRSEQLPEGMTVMNAVAEGSHSTPFSGAATVDPDTGKVMLSAAPMPQYDMVDDPVIPEGLEDLVGPNSVANRAARGEDPEGNALDNPAVAPQDDPENDGTANPVVDDSTPPSPAGQAETGEPVAFQATGTATPAP